MLSKAMLQRQQQMRVTPLKTFMALTNAPTRNFASKSLTEPPLPQSLIANVYFPGFRGQYGEQLFRCQTPGHFLEGSPG
jgi:hypothetical protein